MLFDFKDNNVYDLDIDLDYNNLNLPKNKYEKIYNKRDDINLETGFFLGNIFSDSFSPKTVANKDTKIIIVIAT